MVISLLTSSTLVLHNKEEHMKKTIIVICTLLLLLVTFCLTACAEKETEQENLTCKEMLNRVLKADSITVKCNGKAVFVADDNTIYFCDVYDNFSDEYYFDSTGSSYYAYGKNSYGNWTKMPMSASDYDEYTTMISDAYGIEEYARTLLQYVYDNFDTVMAYADDRYVMATTAFDTVKNFTLRYDNNSLIATFNMYSSYYRVEFFSVNSTTVSLPAEVANAPLGSVSLP